MVGCKVTVLNPSFFFVLASVIDLSSFREREVSGGVVGRVGRVQTSIYQLSCALAVMISVNTFLLSPLRFTR